MENPVKKGHSGVISQLHAIQATETAPMPEDLQVLLSKHQMVFSTPQGLPPSRNVHDHFIPFSQKNEIEKMVQGLFNVGIIRPSMSPYSSPMVMVLKK